MKFDMQKARRYAETSPLISHVPYIAALDEIGRLQAIIMEPVESFGTPALVAWADGLQEILLDFPEEERGKIPFIMSMGEHLEKFAKSWNSQTIAQQAKRIAELEKALIEKQFRLEPAAPSCYTTARRESAIETLKSEGLL